MLKFVFLVASYSLCFFVFIGMPCVFVFLSSIRS